MREFRRRFALMLLLLLALNMMGCNASEKKKTADAAEASDSSFLSDSKTRGSVFVSDGFWENETERDV